MKVATLIIALPLLGLLAAPVAAADAYPQSPPPGSPMYGVETPEGPGEWAQAPEGWVWVPEPGEDYSPDGPPQGYGSAPYYMDSTTYVYVPGYWYWGSGRWLWRAARWALRDHYRDRYWDNYWNRYAWRSPRAYPYRGAPYYGRRYSNPARRYQRYDYWRDNRPLR